MRVVCTLPNASTLINGVVFEAGPQGLVSADLNDAEAHAFAAIPGYTLLNAPEPETLAITPRRGRPPRTPE